MSHLSTVEADVKDLDCLSRAAIDLGLEMVKQPTYKWFGESVGDYPLPEGFSKNDLGKCEYAIRIPGDSRAYEIGVARYPQGAKKTITLADGTKVKQDVSGQWCLLWDFWQGGYGLQGKVGENAVNLANRYKVQVSKKAAVKAGWRVQEKRIAGATQLVCSR